MDARGIVSWRLPHQKCKRFSGAFRAALASLKLSAPTVVKGNQDSIKADGRALDTMVVTSENTKSMVVSVESDQGVVSSSPGTSASSNGVNRIAPERISAVQC
jgi:hypothetical protein